MSSTSVRKGSAHVIIVILLVVALLGALGFIFYQNVMQKKTDTTTTNSTTSATSTTQTTGTAVSLKQFTSQKHLLRFSYPASWSTKETIFTDQADWYSSAVVIKNAEGKLVAELGTGGQFGGACDPDAPYVDTTTLEDVSLTIAGMEKVHYGATIVANEDSTYSVYFGLNAGNLPVGAKKVQCSGMAIGYQYIARAKEASIGSVTFGSWAADSSEKIDSFSSFDAAKAYLSSDEMKQVKAMISSLSVGE